MTPDFLLKAKSNPDLQDFCDYISKPLQILEELEYRYKSLPLDTKVKPINMMTHLKIDKILNQYLPNMVDNYCDFSFKYRNEHFVKIVKTKNGEIFYTAKELLLQNLSKLIEEIHVLEEEFNENNKFRLLVQEKILTNLGYSTDLDEAPAQIVLENKFKYQDQEIFKKPVKEILKKLPQQIEPPSTVNTIEKYNLFHLNFLEVLLMVGFLGFVGSMFYEEHSKIEVKNKIMESEVSLKILQNVVKSYYSTKEDYIHLNKMSSNGLLVPDSILSKEILVNSFGGEIKLQKSTDPNKFEIVYEGVPQNACNKLVQDMNTTFSKITIGAYTIQDPAENVAFNTLKLYDVCGLSSNKNTSITFTSNY